jgi:hypothetical protein
MRSQLWLGLAALWAVWVVFPVCGAQEKRIRIKSRPEAPKPVPWVVDVESDWEVKRDDAVQNALQKAQPKIEQFLREQSLYLEWSPDPKYIQKNLVKDLPPDAGFINPGEGEVSEVRLSNGRVIREEVKDFKGQVGIMRRVCLRVEINMDNRNDMRHQDEVYQSNKCRERAEERQGKLARVLAGVVVMLTAIALYLRLEKRTKGYYTTWLRLGVVLIILLVGAGLFFIG